jgi:hypothetical protein
MGDRRHAPRPLVSRRRLHSGHMASG